MIPLFNFNPIVPKIRSLLRTLMKEMQSTIYAMRLADR